MEFVVLLRQAGALRPSPRTKSCQRAKTSPSCVKRRRSCA